MLPKVTTSVDKISNDKGLLYLLEIEVEGNLVQKIGVTKRKIEQRVCEIVTSYFKVWRYFPYVRPKRFRHVNEVFSKEAMLLNFFKDYKVNVTKPFSGSTELVNVDNLDFIVSVYEEVVKNGKISENSEKQRCEDLAKKKAETVTK